MMNGDEATEFLDLFRARGAEIADACTRCGDCFRACPMTEPGGIADADPGATAAGIIDLITGGAGSDDAERWTEICSGSGNCIPACKHGINPRFMVQMARGFARRARPGAPLETRWRGVFQSMSRSVRVLSRLQMPPETLAPELANDTLLDQEPLDEPATTATTAHRLSILVAEDNEINALLMRSLLGRLGHHAVITTNGEEALESWLSAESAGAPYDLVLMDIQMPKLDGIETTRQIRAREAGQRVRRTPILALTANTLVEDRYACFEAGMDGFLVKPLDREKLADALAGLIASRHIAA